MLQWKPFVGPHAHHAEGSCLVYVVMAGPDRATLYVMNAAGLLYPINTRRAVGVVDFESDDERSATALALVFAEDCETAVTTVTSPTAGKPSASSHAAWA
jgi:hypothetical protein